MNSSLSDLANKSFYNSFSYSGLDAKKKIEEKNVPKDVLKNWWLADGEEDGENNFCAVCQINLDLWAQTFEENFCSFKCWNKQKAEFRQKQILYKDSGEDNWDNDPMQ